MTAGAEHAWSSEHSESETTDNGNSEDKTVSISTSKNYTSAEIDLTE